MSIQFVKPLFLGILMVIALPSVPQQSPVIDSLKNFLSAQSTDTDRAKTMHQLAIQYVLAGDSVHAEAYANATFLLCARLKDRYGMADVTRRIAELYLNHGHWLSADRKFKEALGFLEKDTVRKSRILQGTILMNYAVLAEKMGLKKKAMQLLLDAVLIQEKCQAYRSLKSTYRNIAIIFEYGGDRESAGNYYRKSLEAAIQAKDEYLIFDAYLENARFMINRKNFFKADAYLEAAKSACQLPVKVPLWRQYFLLKANSYIQKKEYDKALNCFSQAQSLIEPHNTLDMLNVLLGRIEVYKAQKKYAKALADAKDVYKIALNDTVNIDMSSRIVILGELVELSEKSGNIKDAYGYLQQKQAFDRRLNIQDMPIQLRELDMKYQATKKDKDLLVLQNNSKKQEIKIQRNKLLNIILFSGICILVLSIALLYMLLYNKKKFAEKKEIIYKQKIEGMKKEQQLISYAAILEGQEQERLRLARDLHDGLNGVLSGIVMQLSAVMSNDICDEQEQALHLNHIIGRINEAVTEVRSIAHNLMPVNLEKLGLDNSLRDLCKTLRSEETDIIYRSYDLSKSISQRKQITIYRMIQELVVNAVKHAGARLILVECLQDGDMLNITVEDDGKGFDAYLPKHKKGMGVDTVKKQVVFLKGNMNIRSLTGAGTTVHIRCFMYE